MRNLSTGKDVNNKQFIIELYKIYLNTSEAQFNVILNSSLLSISFEQVICTANLKQILDDIKIDILVIKSKVVEFRLRPCDIKSYMIKDNVLSLKAGENEERELRILLEGK